MGVGHFSNHPSTLFSTLHSFPFSSPRSSPMNENHHSTPPTNSSPLSSPHTQIPNTTHKPLFPLNWKEKQWAIVPSTIRIRQQQAPKKKEMWAVDPLRPVALATTSELCQSVDNWNRSISLFHFIWVSFLSRVLVFSFLIAFPFLLVCFIFSSFCNIHGSFHFCFF